MSTAQTVINRALRQLGVLRIGDTASAAQSAEALDTLKAIYRSWITTGAFGTLKEVVPTVTNYTAGENERVFRKDESVVSVTLPLLVPSDRLTCDYGQIVAAGDRTPRDGSVVTISDGPTGVTDEFIYDGQLKQWLEIGAITLGTEAPLSRRDEIGLAACLASQLADSYGLELKPLNRMAAGRFQNGLTCNYSEETRLRYPPEYF